MSTPTWTVTGSRTTTWSAANLPTMKWPDLIGGPVIIGPLPSVSAAPSPPARQPCPAWLSRPLPLQASARRPPTRDGRRDCGQVLASAVVWAINVPAAEIHATPRRHEVNSDEQ